MAVEDSSQASSNVSHSCATVRTEIARLGEDRTIGSIGVRSCCSVDSALRGYEGVAGNFLNGFALIRNGQSAKNVPDAHWVLSGVLTHPKTVVAHKVSHRE